MLRVLDQAQGEWVAGRAMHEALGRYIKADDLNAALAELERISLVEQRIGERGPKGGRPSIFWRHVSEQTEQTPTEDELAESVDTRQATYAVAKKLRCGSGSTGKESRHTRHGPCSPGKDSRE